MTTIPFPWPTFRPAPLAVGLGLLLAACGGAGEPDGYGTFEATEVTVSAETGGRLLRFAAREGERIEAGRRVALVDTTQASLRLRELQARRRAAEHRARRAGEEIAALRAELEAARDELRRDRRLAADSAATARQLNRRRREVRVLERRLGAARAERSAARSEAASAQARVEQARERLRTDSFVTNPITGTVLVTYAEAGEHVRPGEPLYDVAATDTLSLHAYLTGGQLARVEVGQTVRVRYDAGPDELAVREGRVTRVADEAEFTPTPVLTREERVNFVYRVEVDVPNEDGVLKVGMPGELVLPATGERRGT